MHKAIKLGVNIDHVATLRQVRGNTRYPDPVEAAFAALNGGADHITIHLREDRRHIQERDLALLSETISTPLNLEMAVTDDMLDLAAKYRPHFCCFVPENREELTTEGGIDVKKHFSRIKDGIARLTELGIIVSLFIEPSAEQIETALKAEAPVIELHTGTYADAKNWTQIKEEISRLKNCCELGHSLGLTVNAGHGLNYHNVGPIAGIKHMQELNIGHAIVARALFCGLQTAVSDMKKLIMDSRL